MKNILSVRRDLLFGIFAILPLAVGVAVYGLAFGVLAAQASMDSLQTGVMGTFVFAGSSQIVAVERMTAGAGAFAALAAGIVLNLRLMLMTASLRDVFAGRPFWQVALGLHLTTDENWALMLATRSKGKDVGYWYLVGGGLCLMATWLISTVCGVTFAGMVTEPRAIGMDFAFTAAFIAILRSLWTGRESLAPWMLSFAIVAAVTFLTPLDATWALILGGIGGSIFAGMRNA